MESVLSKMLGNYENGKLTQRQFIEAVSALAATAASAPSSLAAKRVAPLFPVSVNHMVPGTISHVMFGVSPYDETKLQKTLKAQGLEPKKDLESFLVCDPDNLLVQIGDRKMGLDNGYPPSAG